MIGRLVIDDFFDPVPLHRTATFYLGLFPIVLLLWAWADSLRFSTSWSRYLSGERLSFVIISNSNLAFGSNRRKPGSAPDMIRITPAYGEIRRYNRQSLDSQLFPPLTEPQDTSKPNPFFFDARRRRFPFWFLIAAYLPLWLAASYFHARRKQKRLQQSLPSAQPQTD